MSETAQVTQVVYKKNALDNEKLSLRAKNNVGGNARLLFSINKNNPRFTVFTGDPSDFSEEDKYGRIFAAMDAVTTQALLDKLIEIANGEPGEKVTVICRRPVRDSEARPPELEVASKILVDKDEAGITGITILERNKSTIRFPFIISEFHDFLSSDNKPMTAAQSSRIAALSYAKLLLSLIPTILVDEFHDFTAEKKAERDAKGQSNQGGGYRNNQGGGYRNNQGGGYRNNQGGGYKSQGSQGGGYKNNYQKPQQQQRDTQNDSFGEDDISF